MQAWRGRQLTYAELNAAADALAGRLAPHVHGESVVAILLPRAGTDFFIAQLAIMKAGAAWTCIEPSTPIERLRRASRWRTRRRAGLGEVVTEERLAVVLRGCCGRQVCWEREVQEDLADDVGF